ncbi:MAG: hypothetical protein WCE62_13440 [Polyangiales bacterium]
MAVTQPHAVRHLTVPLALLCATAFACQDAPAPFVFQAVIVDGDDGNPALGTDATTLRIGIQEGTLPAQEFEYPITDGAFDAYVEFSAFTAITRIRVELDGETTQLLTAPPAFVPDVSGGVLRVVTAAPLSCERVTFNQMEAPRAFFGMVQSGTFALVAGGTAPTEEQVEYFDALQWESRLFEETVSLSDLGETRAASIDEGKIVVLPSMTAPFIFDMFDPARRIQTVVLHAGAGPRSALVSIPGVGAMVIGGEVAGRAQSAVSLIEPDGRVSSLQLSEPRSGPAAAALGEDVLVVGGNLEGNAEILRGGDRTGQPITGTIDGVREAGLLIGDGESRALWLGGIDADDVVRLDTLRFDGCPDECASSAGPEWTTARLNPLQPEGSRLIIGGNDSRLVDEVRWNDADVEVLPLLQLNVPRAGAGGLVLESGVFIVAGGDDGASIRDDFEFCVPATLTPL